MLKPARMKKIGLLVHQKDREELISSLYRLGVVELKEASFKGLKKSSAQEELRDIVSLQMSFGSLQDILKLVEEEEKGFSLPRPPKKVEVKGYSSTRELVEESQSFLGEVEGGLKELNNRLSENQTKLSEHSANIALLESIESLDFDLKHLGTGRWSFVKAGFLANENLPSARGELKDYYLFSEEGEEEAVLVVAGLRGGLEGCEEVLKKLHFREVRLELQGKPGEEKERLAGEVKELERENQNIISELKSYRDKHEERITAFYELLRIEKKRMEAYSYFGRTETTCLLEGFLPEKHVDRTLQELESFDCLAEVSEPSGDEDIPVMLDNFKAFKPFELLTETFALPRYWEYDPSPLIAVGFVIFFGLMLTDVVYGAIVALGGAFLYSRLGFKGSYRDMGAILMAAGVSAVVFGAIFGSYLGDFLQNTAGIKGLINPLGSLPVVISGREFVPVMFILLVSILVGLVHINVGFLLSFIKASNKHERLESSWFYLLELGILSYLVVSKPLGYVLLAGGVGSLIYLYGALGFFSITGIFGDVLSYARLLALALATTGIAMAINILTELVAGVPLLGGVIAVVFFLGGHLANMVIQALGGFIHALRLNYVEFFSKFYEGGGRKYRPFRIMRRYTKEV